MKTPWGTVAVRSPSRDEVERISQLRDQGMLYAARVYFLDRCLDPRDRSDAAERLRSAFRLGELDRPRSRVPTPRA